MWTDTRNSDTTHFCIHLCKEKQRNENMYNVQKSRSYSLNTTNLHFQQTNSGHQFEAHFQCWRPISARVERRRPILKFGTFWKCDFLDLHIHLTSNSVSKCTKLLWQKHIVANLLTPVRVRHPLPLDTLNTCAVEKPFKGKLQIPRICTHTHTFLCAL